MHITKQLLVSLQSVDPFPGTDDRIVGLGYNSRHVHPRGHPIQPINVIVQQTPGMPEFPSPENFF
jgi:hypothetical protein